jgi:glycolate oxidase
VTTNHVLGLEVVLPNGDVVHLGGATLDTPGYDLTGLFVGSEGTFGIVTKITVRLLRRPEAWKTLLAVFATIEAASNAVSGIIGAGLIPAALEMMDHLTIQAVEAATGAGLPLDAGAVLLIELDGIADGMGRTRHALSRPASNTAARLCVWPKMRRNGRYSGKAASRRLALLVA